MSSKYKVGDRYKHFEVKRVLPIEELDCTLIELVHVPTGALVMHIANEDQENLFCLSFKTIPMDSTGIAHILEHTVLCGSKKFPVKDPFFAMSRRSLNTFMNALTGADFTCYPAASQEPKDFYNLLEVYLDAVFHPNLNELSFLQEGHRLEFAAMDDPKTPLEHKGVVFNEMKGALSSPTSRLNEVINQALFPDITYGFNSGGEPKEIPKLTYEDFCAFHKKFYQPAHCLFFFYGNLPLEGHLDFIEKETLSRAKKIDPLPDVAPQQRFREPKRLTVDYPISDEEELSDRAIISFGWLTCHILEQQELLALLILELVLMDTDASPLKLALLRSGMCKQASCMMDIDISEIPIIFILRGCQEEDADKLEKLIRGTLEDIVKAGVPSEQIENAMHQIEFHKSEIVGNHSPFGLSLFMRSALLKQHGGDPADGLVIHALLEKIEQAFKDDPHYFTKLIQKYFLNNTHFVRLVMRPNPDLGAKEVNDEKEELKQLKERMTQKEIKQLIEKSLALAEFQKAQEEQDVDVLPKLGIDDVGKQSRMFALSEEELGNIKVFHHNCFTNDIVYADLIYDLPEIAEEELYLVRLLTVLIPQIGCGSRNYAATLQYMQANTGGITSYLSLNMNVQNPQKFSPVIAIRGKALHRKMNKLFPLFGAIVEKMDFFDVERLKEAIVKHYTSLQATVNQNSLRYAMMESISGFTIPDKITNVWYGIEYYESLKKLVENIDEHILSIANRLNDLHQRLLGVEKGHLVLSCDAKMFDEIKKAKFYGLQEMKNMARKHAWKGEFPINKVEDEGFVIASPVAFINQAFKTVPYVHEDAALLSLAAGLLENLVLHQRIREKGGAYGGGAITNTLSATFNFFAYRDPNISGTLEAFEDAVKTISEGHFEDSDLEEAKMEVVQNLDAPVAPGSRAEYAYAWKREGKTAAVRQAFRERLLGATKKDVVAAVKKHIISKLQGSRVVVFAGKELLEKENRLLEAKKKRKLKLRTI